MSVFVLSGLAILIVNRETLARRARRCARRRWPVSRACSPAAPWA